jgi:hypothetical protein
LDEKDPDLSPVDISRGRLEVFFGLIRGTSISSLDPFRDLGFRGLKKDSIGGMAGTVAARYSVMVGGITFLRLVCIRWEVIGRACEGKGHEERTSPSATS